MVSMLVSGKAETPEVAPKHIEFREITEIKNLMSPRVLATHLTWSRLPLDFCNKKSKIIHLLRNPKDVAASMYPFLKKFTAVDYNGTWESFFPTHLKGDILHGSWFDYVLEMEKFESDNPDYPILTVYYEDLHKDCVGELKRIAEFLGQDSNEDLFAAITAKCTFANMKENKSAAADFIKKATKDGTHPLFRKGEVGDWKNTFTVAQSELMDAVYADRMKNSKYCFTYTK